MSAHYYTEQERIDAATMRIDAPVIGSGAFLAAGAEEREREAARRPASIGRTFAERKKPQRRPPCLPIALARNFGSSPHRWQEL
jgi:hypothetical protein